MYVSNLRNVPVDLCEDAARDAFRVTPPLGVSSLRTLKALVELFTQTHQFNKDHFETSGSVFAGCAKLIDATIRSNWHV